MTGGLESATAKGAWLDECGQDDFDLAAWEAPSLREGFDHRGHQCNACGMHHCHMQVIPTGPHRGQIVDEPEYEGWAGAGWAIGCTDPVAISWLNTQIDRIGVDVNEFGWLVGWGRLLIGYQPVSLNSFANFS